MQKFLEFWAGHKSQQDPDGAVLFNEYQAAALDLENSRRKTQAFMMPVNTGKGWHPVFDPDATAAVVNLASEIDQKKAILKAISQAIDEFITIVGGPSLQPLSDQRKELRQQIESLRIKARNMSALEARKNPRLSPAEVQDLPAVMAANADLSEGRADLEPKIAELTNRLEQGRAILERDLAP